MALPHPSLPSSQAGDLLVADPSLSDGVFDRAVILLAEHTLEGAFGLILNQPSGRHVEDYFQQESFVNLGRIPVFVGGPVASEQLTFAAFWKSPSDQLRYAVRISAEEALMHSQNPGTLVKAFVGYTGWSGGQLADELEGSTWLALKPPRELLAMAHDESLWEATLCKASPYHRLLALCPRNPWLN